MVDTTEVLEIAEFNCRESGAVDYQDFEEWRGWELFEVKGILLANGYECHERRHHNEWWDSCGYQKMRTHFHKREDRQNSPR